MKIHISVLLLLVLASSGRPAWANALTSGSVPPKDASQETWKKVYDDFKNRLEAAIASRDIASVAALYQTNDVSAVELKSELARWQRVVAEGAKPMPPFLKTLSQLPPESHDYWEAAAHRLTRHQVTHFSVQMFDTKTGVNQLTLPLVLVGDKLMIVPSEKISTTGIESDGSANRSQPIRRETNSTPAAAGSGR